MVITLPLNQLLTRDLQLEQWELPVIWQSNSQKSKVITYPYQVLHLQICSRLLQGR